MNEKQFLVIIEKEKLGPIYKNPDLACTYDLPVYGYYFHEKTNKWVIFRTSGKGSWAPIDMFENVDEMYESLLLRLRGLKQIYQDSIL